MNSKITFEGTVAEKLRVLAEAIEQGHIKAEFATIVIGEVEGVYRVDSINVGTTETISLLEIGKHIMLNSFMPHGNVPAEQLGAAENEEVH